MILIKKIIKIKGGFMTMENRRDLYKQILCDNQNILISIKYYKIIWMNKN